MPLGGFRRGGATEGQGPVELKYRRHSPPSAAGSRLSPAGLRRVSRRGERMQHLSESEQSIECSGRLVLGCGCGGRLILLGLEEDWRSEQRTDFECSCGKSLSLRSSLVKLNEGMRALRRLHRGTDKVVPRS